LRGRPISVEWQTSSEGGGKRENSTSDKAAHEQTASMAAWLGVIKPSPAEPGTEQTLHGRRNVPGGDVPSACLQADT
jgi:hypothetical protein